ncbi:hypothetical protein EPUS_07893 [Endocarpon pusillum Z07020]|uniref:Tc1-like transposase DDE domain-containing protein n=1 Tax=Endocarpon pusillum (strain Z07020 / HMAS-L-300199) TaxID=1263415 RepID=U1HLR3_ENDPU|nr:uncharacterized protein EPUS_07893 [Endocarpon pusillum Z07020]ERF71210.1 hypothetical protein EPUS_07893 [Endocarpon pusillum Z07020]
MARELPRRRRAPADGVYSNPPSPQAPRAPQTMLDTPRRARLLADARLTAGKLPHNDGPHGTKGVANNKVKQAKIKLNIKWQAQPSNSPDLNPIETIWRIIKQRLKSRGVIFQTETLKAAIQEEWDKITIEEINNAISTMPDRVRKTYYEWNKFKQNELNLHYKENKNRYLAPYVKQQDHHIYRSRFQNELWFDLLDTVIDWFGADKFKDVMAYYRKEDRLMDEVTLEQEVSDHLRKIRRHTNVVPGLHKSDIYQRPALITVSIGDSANPVYVRWRNGTTCHEDMGKPKEELIRTDYDHGYVREEDAGSLLYRHVEINLEHSMTRAGQKPKGKGKRKELSDPFALSDDDGAPETPGNGRENGKRGRRSSANGSINFCYMAAAAIFPQKV